jgi:predicted dehydrogenase
MPAREIGVAVVGLGFMGRVHVRAYQDARRDGLPCRLLAVCSDVPEQLAGIATGGGNIGPASTEILFDPAQVKGCREAAEIAADPRIDLVSICTPTDTHVELAAMMLRAGKHVLVEKPVAVRSADVRELAKVAAESGRLCMPAMCMRFWPGWDWLKEKVTDGKFGRVRTASFTRLGSRPDWSPGFYDDPVRSGGALGDLHVHDADAVLWLFGRPAEVISTGSIDHVATLYRYDHAKAPALVVSDGGWVRQPGFPFRIRYTVDFDKATADWDMVRDPHLLLARAGKWEPVPLPKLSAYDREIRAMVEAAARGVKEAPVTLDSAVAAAELLEAEKRSLETGRPVTLPAR